MLDALVLLSDAAGQPVGVLDVAELDSYALRLLAEVGTGPDARQRLLAILDREADSAELRWVFALCGLTLRRGPDGWAVLAGEDGGK